MTAGPGKYDHLCDLVRKRADADAAVVIIFNGYKGSGFSVQTGMGPLLTLPDILEGIADELRKELTPDRPVN